LAAVYAALAVQAAEGQVGPLTGPEALRKAAVYQTALAATGSAEAVRNRAVAEVVAEVAQVEFFDEAVAVRIPGVGDHLARDIDIDACSKSARRMKIQRQRRREARAVHDAGSAPQMEAAVLIAVLICIRDQCSIQLQLQVVRQRSLRIAPTMSQRTKHWQGQP